MNFQKPKVKAPSFELIGKTKQILDKNFVNTICLNSACPNIGECFERKTATFLILGNICTRRCKFCAVKKAKPDPIDKNEPLNVAKAIKDLNLKYAVITSVDRDDLKDFGAFQFVKTVKRIKEISSDTKIELLTPDFQNKRELLELIISSKPYKLSHNIETVERLSKKIMPGCSYKRSLKVLEIYSKSSIITKSSIMVGLGESKKEILNTLKDLLNAGVSQLTIGQYLSPSKNHAKVIKYYKKEEFEELKERALSMGFKAVASGSLVRSSYYADIL